MTKTELFLELAKPDKNGKSRWVNVSEFTGKYSGLQLSNGLDFGRGSSPLAKKYIVEKQKKGSKITAIRLSGFNEVKIFNQNIRQDIKEYYRTKNCVMLGINGKSENTKIEIDHKEGRKDNARVSNLATQKREDFQPLCKAANDVKRQICKQCKQTDKRWDAKNIKGNPYSFYDGDSKYTKELGCKGCYQYDPVEYRKESVRKISKEAADYVSKKLFSEEK
ncbi:MAG: hypothetical protein LBR69_06800 [Endomicrobium sp.]|jgi:hypothetical protein|nr:hypothetical protein [Endomicrobium sp.]